MDWQLLVVCGMVATATLFVARSTWRTWFGSRSGGCGSGCGKCSATPKPETAADKKRIALPQV